MNLSTSLDKIKGVGPRTYSQLKEAGLLTVRDLINFLPRGYENFASAVSIGDIKPGNVMVKARASEISTKRVRRGMSVTNATLSDETGKISAVWFNQAYREKQISSNKEFYFSGRFEFNKGRYQLMNPRVELAKEVKIEQPSSGYLAIYKSKAGLKIILIRDLIKQLKPILRILPETLPGWMIEEYDLLSRCRALFKIHFPETEQDLQRAKHRLAFEEVFQLTLAAQLNRQENSKIKGYKIKFKPELIKQAIADLPFKLTDSQRLATWQILQDFERSTPMNRLLQGDVGSGKTVVAALSAFNAVKNGYQVAIMAPTEVLATQHAKSISKLFETSDINVALLTGSVKGAARKLIYQKLASGEIDIIIGTHALIQSKIEFSKLGFVVIDEQHRFGVKQRQALLDKSNKLPHLLSMTATPIPRSLALTLYGELDVSVLTDKPAGRKPIITEIVSPNSREQLYRKIESEISAGRQAYIVCGLIDENSDNELKSVEAEYKKLDKKIFLHRRIGLLHGKMKPSQKEEIMLQFKNHEIDILISTTVVEVGVDVPNASVIVIEDAEQFGLSQLHQLRGRVGRAEHQSYCFLVMGSSKKPSRRLEEIKRSDDGFYLSEVDLKLRGPGEVYGRMQHGALNLQIASLADTKLIASAQTAAKEFVQKGEDLLEYKELRSSVQKYQRLTTLN